ncbi:MAG TPA: hypothetical protein VNI57_03985 [Candidatus Saccharimonadales bacterium]|nr:hypothetical protein [Candidatus Saccharimonadales bacterium]
MRVHTEIPKRIAHVLGVLVVLLGAASLPAVAQTGRIGQMYSGLGSGCWPEFSWRGRWDAVPLNPGDTVTMSMQIIPFDDGQTILALSTQPGGSFFGLTFDNGKTTLGTGVNGGHYDGVFYDGPRYKKKDWNDVSVEIRPATQDFVVTINGETSAPAPFSGSCSVIGGCYSATDFVLWSRWAKDVASAWIDSFSVTLHPVGGAPQTIYEATFDDNAAYSVFPGALTPALDTSSKGPVQPAACAPVQDVLEGIRSALSTKAFRSASGVRLAQRVGATMRRMKSADTRAARAVSEVIPMVQAERDQALSAQDADRLIAMSAAVVDNTSLPSTASGASLASLPEGNAGKLDTGHWDSGMNMCRDSLKWYPVFGFTPLLPTDTLSIDMALIPFDRGLTILSMDMFGGGELFAMAFEDGSVLGLPYDRYGWNDVHIDLDLQHQSFMLSVNGEEAGPFPFRDRCAQQGGCFNASAFRLLSADAGITAHGWVDSFSITLTPSGSSPQTLYSASFDDETIYTTYPGTLVSSPPPVPGTASATEACPGPEEAMREIEGLLSSPPASDVVGEQVLHRIRASISLQEKAGQAAALFLDRLARTVEAKRGRGISRSKADALLTQIRMVRAVLPNP